MLINEISRFSQVTDKTALIETVMAKHGVSVDAMAEHIISEVNAVADVTKEETAKWYHAAHSFCLDLAIEYGVEFERVIGVVAAVSPRMPWLRNKNVAEKIIATYLDYENLSASDAARSISLAMGANVAMAFNILRAEKDPLSFLTGVKRQSFYNNIFDPILSDSVTVDTWAMMVYVHVTGNDKKAAEGFVRASKASFNGTGVGYIAIAEAYRRAAKVLNMPASAVQAVYWCSAAGSTDGSRSYHA